MIWLIGNKGMLGYDVEVCLKKQGLDYIATDLDVDITDLKSLEEFLHNRSIDWIINCAAYTHVDRAEDEREKAFKINSLGASNLAKLSCKAGAKLIHISTDYVFFGTKEEYFEDDTTNPRCVYAESKLAGEKVVALHAKKYFIIRTSWLYGEHGKNFVFTMLNLFKERGHVSIVNDQFGSPTYSLDLAEFICKLISLDSSAYGIYHFSNNQRTTWYEFGRYVYLFAKELGIIKKEVEILPIKSDEYPVKAKRPKSSYLSKDKVKKTFGVDIKDWQASLLLFLKKVKDKYSG